MLILFANLPNNSLLQIITLLSHLFTFLISLIPKSVIFSESSIE
jgi:hypothetical protein